METTVDAPAGADGSLRADSPDVLRQRVDSAVVGDTPEHRLYRRLLYFMIDLQEQGDREAEDALLDLLETWTAIHDLG